MSDAPDSLILVYLRRVDAKLDRLGEDVRDLRTRVSAVESGLNAVRRDLVVLAEADARLQVSVDRQGERLDRIERRLELQPG